MQWRSRTDRPVTIVGAEIGAVEVSSEWVLCPPGDLVDDKPEVLVRDVKVQSERVCNVEAVDDVVAKGALKPATGRLPGIVQVVPEGCQAALRWTEWPRRAWRFGQPSG